MIYGKKITNYNIITKVDKKTTNFQIRATIYSYRKSQ